jgi:hypothetical protein
MPTLTPADTADRVWHTMSADEVLRVQGVDRGSGLSWHDHETDAVHRNPRIDVGDQF